MLSVIILALKYGVLNFNQIKSLITLIIFAVLSAPRSLIDPCRCIRDSSRKDLCINSFLSKPFVVPNGPSTRCVPPPDLPDLVEAMEKPYSLISSSTIIPKTCRSDVNHDQFIVTDTKKVVIVWKNGITETSFQITL